MDPDVQNVLGFYTHYIMLPGYTQYSALRAALARFPGIPPARQVEIGRLVPQLAQVGESVARAIEAMWETDPTAPLSLALGNLAQPAPTVAVRAIATLPDGTTRSAVIQAFWGETAESVKDRARDMLADESDPAFRDEDVIWSIRGPTLAPSPNAQ